MPGDYSRKIFDKKKHYSGVLMQQGRVQLDADWNEEVDIEQYRTFTETTDVIGAAGAPKKNAGFKITVAANATDLLIGPGRMYVEGLMCELEPDISATYRNQPYYPDPDLFDFVSPSSPPASPPVDTALNDGSYIVYLKAWQREINYLDNPLIQEKALGEADTTTRLQTVWQVRLLKINDNGAGNCSSPFPEWDALTAPLNGKLNAKTGAVNGSTDPCVLPPSAGYLRLENQLYRVQVQKTDSAKKAQSFKWSRDNASVETTIEDVSGKVLTVNDIGKDEILGFAGDQWVEIVDAKSSLDGNPHPLVQIDSINPDSRKITLKTSVPQFENKNGLKLRRWDISGLSATQDGLPVTPGWMNIEDGIQVRFSNGTFEVGDYWLVPARTATGDIEWPQIAPDDPAEQPRIGTNYFYCRLAFIKIQNRIVVVQEDCRELFPSLTDIEECDLKEHNKYLHGYGVVCGLKVRCGANRKEVLIEPGYALDCEGNAIKNKKILPVKVIDRISSTPILDEKGNGLICLSIGYNGGNEPIISIEPFVPPDFLDDILEGTLLKDFLEGCIKSLFQSVKAELTPITQAVPVPIQQRRLTSLINLVYQLLNPMSGQYAFISGNLSTKHDPAICAGGKLQDKDEDELLYCFYEKLKALLASETYCGQFNHDPYPDYTLAPGLDTIFGTPLKKHTRLRLDAGGNFAYTCKGDKQIFVYDLKTGEFIKWLDFPDPTALIQDVCVVEDQKSLLVSAISSNNKDTVFAIASLSNLGAWQGPFTVQNVKFVTLGIHQQTGRLFGIAKANGLYEVFPHAGGVDVRPTMNRFNATGLMAVADDEQLHVFATEDNNSAIGSDSDNFNAMRSVNLATGGEKTFNFRGHDPDNDLVSHNGSFYATGDKPDGSGMRILEGWRQNEVKGPIDLETTESFVRLAGVRQNSDLNALLVSFSDQSKVLKVVVRNFDLVKVETGFRIPVHAFPMSMAIANLKSDNVYVLNTVINTIIAIDVNKVIRTASPPNYVLDPEIIADYREDAIKAYRGLLINLLQYLKDCFCDKFLIDCPQCSEKDKFYLGTIDIRNSEIYHICNFTKRKYVKTFRTWGYWLSVVPILPLIKKLFAMFCCTVVGDSFLKARK